MPKSMAWMNILVVFSSSGVILQDGRCDPTQPGQSQESGGEEEQPGNPFTGQFLREMVGQSLQVEGRHTHDVSE